MFLQYQMWIYQEVNCSKFWKGNFFYVIKQLAFVRILQLILLSPLCFALNFFIQCSSLFLKYSGQILWTFSETVKEKSAFLCPEELKWFETLLSTWSMLMLPLCSAIFSLSSLSVFPMYWIQHFLQEIQ